jgi:hypothetical protein
LEGHMHRGFRSADRSHRPAIDIVLDPILPVFESARFDFSVECLRIESVIHAAVFANRMCFGPVLINLKPMRPSLLTLRREIATALARITRRKDQNSRKLIVRSDRKLFAQTYGICSDNFLAATSELVVDLARLMALKAEISNLTGLYDDRLGRLHRRDTRQFGMETLVN